jgi:RimJ/RimL family protein N-acetyltransferase
VIETPRGTILETPRLILRHWRPEDRAPFARINADPRVMRFFPGVLSPAESDGAADRIAQALSARGWGLYAAELRESQAFIGFVGLAAPGRAAAHLGPCVEIGWRLAAECWNRGLATEGARAVARHAFETLRLRELVSYTAALNAPSRRVMEKLGMTYDPAVDFDNVNFRDGDPLRPHVVYRLRPLALTAG